MNNKLNSIEGLMDNDIIGKFGKLIVNSEFNYEEKSSLIKKFFSEKNSDDESFDAEVKKISTGSPKSKSPSRLSQPASWYNQSEQRRPQTATRQAPPDQSKQSSGVKPPGIHSAISAEELLLAREAIRQRCKPQARPAPTTESGSSATRLRQWLIHSPAPVATPPTDHAPTTHRELAPDLSDND